MNKTKLFLLVLIIVFAFVGFLDATYLTILHFKGEVPDCSIIKGCEIVTTSKYSVIWGVPVSLMGSIYYLTMLVASFWSLQSKSTKLFKIMFIFSLGSFIFSFYLLFLMFFIIGAVCQYCLLSAVTSSFTFVFSTMLFIIRNSLRVKDISQEGK